MREFSLPLDDKLHDGLAAIAREKGQTIEELAGKILRHHIDSVERDAAEYAEDEQRWQNYLESGHSVPFDVVRGRLHALSQEAAAKVETQ